MDPKMGPKIPQKSALGCLGPPRDANGRPEGSMEQFWSLMGLIFEVFGCNFGPFLNLRSSFGHPQLCFKLFKPLERFLSLCPFDLWSFFLGELNHHTSKPQTQGAGGMGAKPLRYMRWI